MSTPSPTGYHRWPHWTMLWFIPVTSRRGDPTGEYDHAVAVEGATWADAALSVADDPEGEVVPSPADLIIVPPHLG